MRTFTPPLPWNLWSRSRESGCKVQCSGNGCRTPRTTSTSKSRPCVTFNPSFRKDLLEGSTEKKPIVHVLSILLTFSPIKLFICTWNLYQCQMVEIGEMPVEFWLNVRLVFPAWSILIPASCWLQPAWRGHPTHPPWYSDPRYTGRWYFSPRTGNPSNRGMRRCRKWDRRVWKKT